MEPRSEDDMGIAALLLAEGGVKSADEKRLKLYRHGRKNIRAAEVAPEGAEVLGELIARQPTIDDVGAIFAHEEPVERMVAAVLRCAIDPETGGRAFNETATEAIRSNPAGSWPRDVSDAILGLIPKQEDRAAVGEGSGETAPSKR